MGRLSWGACSIMLSVLGCGARVASDAGGAAGSGASAGSDASGNVDAGASGNEDAGAGGSTVDIPGPGPVAQRARVLYEGSEWTKPADSHFGVSTCRVRLVPGCEGISSPEVIAAAVDGQRLVAAFWEDPNWTLLVSDDLGKTVRRFALGAPLDPNDQTLTLHLFHGRIFVLAWLKDAANPGAALPVFEVDPLQGGIAQRGGDETTSVPSGAAPDGSFTTVSRARDVAQAVRITRFDPAANRITRSDLPCFHEACGTADPFVFRGGDLFNARSDSGCVVSVHVASKALAVDCPAGLAAEVPGTPLSSFGSAGYDFEIVALDHALYPDVPWSIFPVAKSLLRSAPGIDFTPFYLYSMGHGLLAYSPSGFVTGGDEALLRLLPTGELEQTKLVHDGCLSLTDAWYFGGTCPQVVRVLPLAGDEVLLISLRDEFNDDVHSRWLFDVSRSTAPFTAFTP